MDELLLEIPPCKETNRRVSPYAPKTTIRARPGPRRDVDDFPSP